MDISGDIQVTGLAQALCVSESVGAGVNVLILRAWVEPGRPDGLRIRIVQITERGESAVATASNIDDACTAIREWLEQLVRSDGPASAPW